MQVQIMGQSATRPAGLPVPWPDRLRCTDRRNGLQQRPGYQRHTDPPRECGLRPRPWHLHGSGVLGNKEVRLYRPAMLIAGQKFFHVQLPRRRADHQRFVIGWVIDPHHIEENVGKLLIVERVPAPQPDVTLLSRERGLSVGGQLWHRSPGVQHGTVHRRTPRVAGCIGKKGATYAASSRGVITVWDVSRSWTTAN